jgi:hypothetical protein
VTAYVGSPEQEGPRQARCRHVSAPHPRFRLRGNSACAWGCCRLSGPGLPSPAPDASEGPGDPFPPSVPILAAPACRLASGGTTGPGHLVMTDYGMAWARTVAVPYHGMAWARTAAVPYHGMAWSRTAAVPCHGMAWSRTAAMPYHGMAWARTAAVPYHGMAWSRTAAMLLRQGG